MIRWQRVTGPWIGLVCVALVTGTFVARAQEAPADAPPDQVDELQKRIDELEDKLERLESVQAAQHDQIAPLLALPRFLKVWIDVGGFAVGGNGSGIRSDIGHVYFPQYDGRLLGQWVFMGDPLSTAINSLGEPADTSDSRELKTDTVHAGGHPSLIVNSVALAIGKDVTPQVSVAALAELLPRPDHDLLDVELANVQWRPREDLTIAAGKIDSVLGLEYRTQDAPNRLGVTPSLICRYTCGREIGVRAYFQRGPLSLSGTIADRDSFQDRFEPEPMLHSNSLPTAAGHVQWRLDVGQGLEIGVSGAVGPQTGQSDLGIAQWHVGLDARLFDLEGWQVSAEYVQGLQQGKTEMTPCDIAPCLTYKGAYLMVDKLVNPHFTPYVRVDWRDAVHQSGVQFVYESHVIRATFGVQLAMTSRILGKIEYTFNHELDGIPQFADDIVTSSIVVATD